MPLPVQPPLCPGAYRFPSTFVLYMFYLDSAIEDLVMNLKFLLLVGGLIALEVPIRAQEGPEATGTEIESTMSGIRIDEASNGFQLVEHGLWSSPKALVFSGTNADDAAPSSPLRRQPASATGDRKSTV